jgi:hypothetical protein
MAETDFVVSEPREQQLVASREQMRLMENELVSNQRRMQQLESTLADRGARMEVMSKEISSLRYCGAVKPSLSVSRSLFLTASCSEQIHNMTHMHKGCVRDIDQLYRSTDVDWRARFRELWAKYAGDRVQTPAKVASPQRKLAPSASASGPEESVLSVGAWFTTPWSVAPWLIVVFRYGQRCSGNVNIWNGR